MAFFDLLIWFVLGTIVGGLVGIGAAKFIFYLTKIQDQKKILEIIEGNLQNKIKMDGETIDIDKFVLKDNDGKMIHIDLKSIKKTPSKALKSEKTTVLERIKGFFKKNG